MHGSKRTTRTTTSQKAELWRRWKDGQPLTDIGLALARHAASIHGVLLPKGGVAPATRRRSRLALTPAEREEISRGIAADASIRQIAARIGRPPSTVSRELSRHRGRRAYRAADADSIAWEDARRRGVHRHARQDRDQAQHESHESSVGRRSHRKFLQHAALRTSHAHSLREPCRRAAINHRVDRQHRQHTAKAYDDRKPLSQSTMNWLAKCASRGQNQPVHESRASPSARAIAWRDSVVEAQEK